MRKKKDIEPTNDKGQRHGLWEFYYHDGRLMFKGFYHNDKQVGYNGWHDYTGHNGELTLKRYHI
jgi:antitoxin component YwqK of YwqJK toxin-antitoxin module